MSANNGGINHLNTVLTLPGLVQRLQHHVPEPRQRPTPKLAVDRVPLAKMAVQITPGRARSSDPEYPVKHQTVILDLLLKNWTGLS